MSRTLFLYSSSLSCGRAGSSTAGFKDFLVIGIFVRNFLDIAFWHYHHSSAPVGRFTYSSDHSKSLHPGKFIFYWLHKGNGDSARNSQCEGFGFLFQLDPVLTIQFSYSFSHGQPGPMQVLLGRVNGGLPISLSAFFEIALTSAPVSISNLVGLPFRDKTTDDRLFLPFICLP